MKDSTALTTPYGLWAPWQLVIVLSQMHKWSCTPEMEIDLAHASSVFVYTAPGEVTMGFRKQKHLHAPPQILPGGSYTIWYDLPP